MMLWNQLTDCFQLFCLTTAVWRPTVTIHYGSSVIRTGTVTVQDRAMVQASSYRCTVSAGSVVWTQYKHLKRCDHDKALYKWPAMAPKCIWQRQRQQCYIYLTSTGARADSKLKEVIIIIIINEFHHDTSLTKTSGPLCVTCFTSVNGTVASSVHCRMIYGTVPSSVHAWMPPVTTVTWSPAAACSRLLQRQRGGKARSPMVLCNDRGTCSDGDDADRRRLRD